MPKTKQPEGDDEGQPRKGYGVGVVDLTFSKNPLNRGKRYIPYTLKRRWNKKLNFVDFDTAYVIPYMHKVFWRGTGDPQNAQNFDSLRQICSGIRYKTGRIRIEVLNIVRQRLIDTGATTQVVYDFEDGQTLMVGTHNRVQTDYGVAISGAANTISGMNVRVETTYNNPDISGNNTDISEIPSKGAWEKEFDFDILPKNKLYNASQPWITYTGLMPCVLGIEEIDDTVLTDCTEIYVGEETREGIKIKKTFQRELTTNPMMTLSKPTIDIETGHMKFEYNIRITTELDMELYPLPDYANAKVEAFNRRHIIDTPTILNPIGTVLSIPCYGYHLGEG